MVYRILLYRPSLVCTFPLTNNKFQVTLRDNKKILFSFVKFVNKVPRSTTHSVTNFVDLFLFPRLVLRTGCPLSAWEESTTTIQQTSSGTFHHKYFLFLCLFLHLYLHNFFILNFFSYSPLNFLFSSLGIILCEMIARVDADPDTLPRTQVMQHMSTGTLDSVL